MAMVLLRASIIKRSTFPLPTQGRIGVSLDGWELLGIRVSGPRIRASEQIRSIFAFYIWVS